MSSETPEPQDPAASSAASASASPDQPPVAGVPPRSRPPVDLAACAAELRTRFPAVFGVAARPLKLRIQADIQERAPGVFTRQALSAFLHRHTTSTNYLIALSQQPQRLDLDGQPAGEVAAEHRDAAAQEVQRRRALRQERQAQMHEARRAARQAERERQAPRAGAPAAPADRPRRARSERAHAQPAAGDERTSAPPLHPDEQARRERARLLRDFDGSPLTRANFCALKGIAPETLDAQLALARQEAAARLAARAAAPPPAAPAPRPPPHASAPAPAPAPARAHDPGSRRERPAQRPTEPRPAPRPPPPQPPRAPQAPPPPQRVLSAEALQRLVQAIVERGGSTAAEAACVAQHLVDANLAGHDAQGVAMLPRYVDDLLAGALQANREAAVLRDHGALLTLDGQAGYGAAIGTQAMQLGIERARAHGVAVLGLTRSHHLGRIGAFAEQCLAAGLVSIHFVNVLAAPVSAPYGGSDLRLGANPLCLGIPQGADAAPLLLDFATSRGTTGRTRAARQRGATHDAPLPFGGYKGYGLALACELLAGALTGGLTLHAAPTSAAIGNNMLSFIVDPERLGTAAHLAQQAQALAAWVKASPPARETAAMFPGEPEHASRQRRRRDGIPLPEAVWTALLHAGTRLGLDEPALSARWSSAADSR